MENIKSLQENPFFKHYGIRHNNPPDFRTSNRSETLGLASSNKSLNEPLSPADEDEIGEYHPVSGFVHKLLDKFSSLSAREEQTVLRIPFKRSTSFDENKVTANKPKLPTDAGVGSTFDKSSYLSTTPLSYRARSIENLSHTHHKPPQYNNRISLQLDERALDKNKYAASSNFQKDHHLSRDNIIIIENTPAVLQKGFHNDELNGNIEPREVVGNLEIVSKDELPKPNTVLTVRSIFENSFSGTGLYTRRHKSDQPLSPSSPSSKALLSPLQTELSASNQITASKRGSIQLPSPVTSPRHDTHAKPVILPNSSPLSKPSDYPRYPSDSYLHSRSEDVKSLASTFSTSSEINHSESQMSSKGKTVLSGTSTSSSYSNSVPAIDDTSASNDGNTIFDATRSSSKQHSTSSRSTASVKPTIHNKQSAPVKPVPLTAPASSTTSYQKSRPVVSVAPYKDKPEDGKDDGQPMMIFSKSKLSPRGEKSQLNSIPKDIKDEDMKQEKNIILEDINDKSGHKKVLSHGRSIDANNKNAENNIPDQSREVPKKHRTFSEFIDIQNNVVDREQLSKGKEIDLKPIKPAASSSIKLAKPTRMAPEPPIQPDSSRSTATVSTNSVTHPIKKETNNILSNSVISTDEKQSESPKDTSSGKRSHQQDGATMNEQPLKKVNKDKPKSQDQPVKGIPSIIAQRLRQQNSNPSQLALDVVTSSNDNLDSTDSGGLYSRTLLSPTSVNIVSSSSDKTEKDTLSSEIENEIAAVRRKMEANRLKAGPAQIFDSSLLAKKKKEKRSQQIPSEGPVPPLDLSSVTDDAYIMDYQPQRTKIKPCNIVFIGENAKTSRSLLDKKRKIKRNVNFGDLKTEKFEYPSEETALEKYLKDHPGEKEEMLLLENDNGKDGESSDDMQVDAFESSNEVVSSSLLKSNTSLAHTGNLETYRGRFQPDYEFGAVFTMQPQTVVEPEPAVDPDKIMLRPAEEDVTDTWSANNSSDLLF